MPATPSPSPCRTAGSISWTAKLRLKANQSLDYEVAPSVDLAITATDAAGKSRTELFTIAVGDVNDAPIGLALSSTHVAADSAGAVVGSVTVSDEDPQDSWSSRSPTTASRSSTAGSSSRPASPSIPPSRRPRRSS